MMESKKKVCIIARCTVKEKEMIHRKAVSMNKSDSKYILDSCVAGVERKTDKQRKYLKEGVDFIELANAYRNILISHETEMPDSVFNELNDKFQILEEKSLCLF